ncbi:MAG: M60 family metallopeptidase [Armatimonadetes bacterium]|nr:M60 family metallopeptidase [Armatimonadota bacterium]
MTNAPVRTACAGVICLTLICLRTAAFAPWAEIGSDKVILTVPISAARGLQDPTALMQFWNRVLDADADLAGRPRERERPERYVADEQISAGYMHSGYPIMTHLDAAPWMLDREGLSAGRHAWGLFHEMGHNHQSRYWTFDGTTEVTVNLFTLYVLDTVCGIAPAEQKRLNAESRAKMMQDYLDHGRDFAYWRKKPFLALVMYVQLQEAFGWEAYRKVFAEYRDAPKDELPRTDDEARDQWLVRMSRTVGRNLGPFFEAWSVPVSDEARAAVADLPVWLPEDFPPADAG